MNVTELPRNKQQLKSTRSRSFLYSGTGTVPKFFGMSNWKRMCTDTRDKCRISYPVHNLSPSFHRYALKDGYHSYCNVIKSRDAVVRTDPVSTAVEAFITFSPAKYLSNSLKWSLITWSGILFHWTCKDTWTRLEILSKSCNRSMKKRALELLLTDNCWTKKRDPALTNNNWRKQFNEPIRTK